MGVVRDHGGRHGAPDLDIRVGEDVAASQPPAHAPSRPLLLGVKPDLVSPGVTGAEVTRLGGQLGIIQGICLLRGPFNRTSQIRHLHNKLKESPFLYFANVDHMSAGGRCALS